MQDLENTTGSWEMYGQDSDKRYPTLQNEFFERAGDALSRREALRGVLALCEYSSSSSSTPAVGTDLQQGQHHCSYRLQGSSSS
jgi:hypothetical protein